jgi:hypothetical protein
MINKSFLLFLPILFTEICFSKDLKPSEDRRKVEFFEKLYDIKIKGVKPIDEYQDPDTFYSEIAKQVGIPKIVYEVVEEKFGWKNDDKNFILLMIKGGGNNNAWGVMVTKVPTAIKNLQGEIKNAKTAEEKQKFLSERVDLLREMEMRMVVVGYDGKISFPQKKN